MSGSADPVLDPVHSQYEVIFVNHQDLVVIYPVTWVACDGTELGYVGYRQW